MSAAEGAQRGSAAATDRKRQKGRRGVNPSRSQLKSNAAELSTGKSAATDLQAGMVATTESQVGSAKKGVERAASRTDDREERDSPWRRCAITRNRRPKEQLLRFVVAPTGGLVEDVAARLPGRGIHVLPDRKRVTALLTRHKMGRESIEVVLERLARGLEQRLLDGIGLARRTGGCRVGLREAEEWIRRGAKPLILLAEDAEGVQERLAPPGAEQGGVEIVRVPGGERLDALWSGRPVVVVVVLHAGVGARIRVDAARWWSFTH
ncbi:MAG: DUF448 domain-containing protein [Magnetococcus sp. YQC-9]